MVTKSRDDLKQTKTELTRLVIQGPTFNRDAASSAGRLVCTLKDGASADSVEFRLARHLRGQFDVWFANEQALDLTAQRDQRAAMLLAIGELVDLAGRRLHLRGPV